MYIKKVIIRGFKTYKNKTEIDNFSPHHNVVVGFNGSGKSNFFAAIRFVLSDDYTNLKREERRSLIYQGTSSVMSGYVEIVFHGAENRTLLGAQDGGVIHIRRTVGLKKDEYMINNKNASRSDVQRLLESAGFSTSNPYNIVPQGRIVSLTNAQNRERLQLLEEVIGAKSFERKLKESLQKMETTEKNREKIRIELEEVEAKLNELDEERKELEKYNSLDRKRKMCQFALYDRELNEVTSMVEKLDGEYTNTLVLSEQYIQELEKRESLIETLTKSLNQLGSELKMKESTDLQQAKDSELELAKHLADLNVKYEELISQNNALKEQSASNSESLLAIRSQIAVKEQQLARLSPRFEQLTIEEAAMKAEFKALQQRQRDLLAKRGKYSQFRNKAERDAWIDQELSILKEELQCSSIALTSISEERDSLRIKLTTLDDQIMELNDSAHGPGINAELEDVQQELTVLKKAHLFKIDERKQLWRSEQKIQSVLESLVDDVKRAEGTLSETMDRSLATGLKNVSEIAQRLNLPEGSVFGPLGELIKISEKYKACAEVVGGTSLFHVVVDTENTAALLMQELYNSKGGRVTFIPLNRVHVDSNIVYPSNDEHHCTPLIKKIKYDPKFERAIKHVFGKTIVVKDLNQGTKLAKQFRLNAITLDGDKADSRGVLTGGFHDHHKQKRLDSMRDLKSLKKEQQGNKSQLEEVKEKLHSIDQEIDELNDKIKKSMSRREMILTQVEAVNIKLEKAKRERFLLEETMVQLISKEEKAKINQKLLQDKLDMYTEDLSRDFDTELTLTEREELDEIAKKLPDLENLLNTTTDALSSVVVKIDSLKAELDSKLKPQAKELEDQPNEIMSTTAIQNLQEHIDAVEDERKTLLERKSTVDNEVQKISEIIDTLKSRQEEEEKSLEKANSQQRALLKKLDNYQKEAEKSMLRKMTLSTRRDELQQKIRDIGLLPDDSADKYHNMSSSELLKELSSINDKISKMTNVNKRALENFKKFDDKQKDVMKRAKELDESKESIEKLIDKLKKQKVEAVENTFKKVSENFTQLFEKMVPRGTGKLVIHRRENEPSKPSKRQQKKRKRQETEDVHFNDDQDENSSQDSIYSGVSIEVSFNSKKDEQVHVEQLSGGQKTVCAIALILAIQMVDPAPFYLFDEIDAALDKQYRTAVAATVKQLSSQAQFICTTFRGDMIAVADRFYRVNFENKISTVVEVTKAEALNFVTGREKNENVI
ncbi:AAL182Wp [Eremothecium gossypii ATCC 10895]|uniref:Structural maintenance of chromosomes protein n=1 Tax=Eremothecium gossypii (strain ATCC 10895 / CBS 109.51 / FGSC 9923 / NRRL Y-1056) TaxID=284811 RepID=Q75FB3_EREGS|nr:AAL182Wp [Eremothecium gossypii ATCC 10895]AAS50184.1 AAL182Wp [Eremothecium gossypii ATCC 10895]AEY94469.1 FAAL182Wp [Eremothecium gossypii FDAG1]